MDKKLQRIKIAEACGWTNCTNDGGFESLYVGTASERKIWVALPDYLNDLNAMHEALSVAHLDRAQKQAFLVHLKNLVGPNHNPSEQMLFWVMIHANAAQRAEAFLRTLKSWHDQ
jgi:hypothetical protein